MPKTKKNQGKSMDTISQVCKVIIAPSIGIARLGNSSEEYFLGPEAVGHAPKPAGGFKDKQGRIKRQGARFRIFGLDEQGSVVAELTADQAKIEWTVELANTKASFFEFHGRFGRRDLPRNQHVKDRASLEIKPGPRSITGRSVRGPAYCFDSGQFCGDRVPLGELLTDEDGRLVVLGGFGHSASVPEGKFIKNYANNTGWHDDTSDGPVSARVRFPDGRELIAEPARVLCVPPKYTPELENIVTLYDVMEYAWYEAAAVPVKVSFTDHVYPILKRLSGYPWVNGLANRGHGPGKGGDFFSTESLATLSTNTAASEALRQSIFQRVRDPNLPLESQAAKDQANFRFMPGLAGDNNGPTDGDPTQWLRLRPSQYAILKAWATGDFLADWQGPPLAPALKEMNLPDRPAALTRAALEPCVGGAFYPGIEMTYIAEDKTMYGEPFRLRSDIAAGGITCYMACPWQADFYECNTAWWPIARPDDVVTEAEFNRVIRDAPRPDHASLHPEKGDWSMDPQELMADRLSIRERWERGLVDYPAAAAPGYEGDAGMVELWSGLGFVVSRPTPTSTHERVFVETERAPYLGMDYRAFYYYLSNIDRYPDFLPKAQEIAQEFLDRAWRMQDSPDFPDTSRFFEYSEEAFEARLNEIYTELVEANDAYDPATDEVYRTREDVRYRILQMAPFNQNDGAWIHSITPPGPLDEVDACLFEIWSDEVGNGNVAHSHCNLYTDLMRQEGIYLPDPRSLEYSQDPRFLDSAFTVPLMELALAQFPRLYYPELLGFTLQLEWTVVSLKPGIKRLRYFGIDPHFYVLHVGIDNAASGHGAKARQAVKMYLDKVLQLGGPVAMQEAWKRIWTGYIAFDMTGNLGRDMTAQLKAPKSTADKIYDIIVQKKPYVSQNHVSRKLGDNYINDWFEQPSDFMKALVDGGFFVPGHPEQSSFFRRTSFEGPMFKVFTDDELATWRLWTQEGCPLPEKSTPPRTRVPVQVLMAETIETLQSRQVNAPSHKTQTVTGSDVSGHRVTWTVAEWFEHVHDDGPAAVIELMKAISDPVNELITKGDPSASPFVTSLLAPNGAMGQAFDEVAPHSGGVTHRQLTIEWITAGCPLPQLNTDRGRRITADVHSNPEVYPRARLRGNGVAH
ncbi:LodA/GoxA family CTQ-dependent oxidase [Paraburkholderia caribensis]|uniref:LodA/GoxA family CTQ-dependent oxidase n=1 Tax=Paraburkholderia caribensis TaxID=75105 RepID=UPI0009E9887D|nr:LodA/GoxA family CTQ-dependent oxidase [Paraburkholderia caribensis]AUT58011.1 hypothetical protein C2L66_39875 [Paraburkholderia caribensis]